MAKYDKDKVIGTGTFGYVWLVKSKLSRQSYVLKEINLNLLSDAEQQQALKEGHILSRCKHENIIKYKETIVDPDKNILSIVMEYAEGGDLHNAILKQNGVPFKEHRIISWFTQICLALQYIHYQNILHRDLKSQNIFLGRNKIIKLGDFGIARVLQGPDDLANTAVGTPYYLSPEIYQRKPYNHKSDMWALGCVLFELVTLQHAFKADNFIHLVSLVRNAVRGNLPKDCNPFLRRLIDSMLSIDPKERPCTTEILADPVLQQYLSEYLTTQNGKRNLSPVDTKTISKRSPAGDVCKTKKHTMKRKNSSAVSSKVSKLLSAPLLKNTMKVQTGQFVDSRPCSSKTIKNISSIISRDKSEKELTYKISKVSFALHMNKDSDLTRSCDTYVLDENPRAGNTVPKFTKSEDFSFNRDYGYYTEERCDDELFDIDSDENCPSERMDLKDLHENVFLSNSKYLKMSHNKRMQHFPDGSVHQPCPHIQCHQCMLDMLWDNRIRGVGTIIDTEDRTRLRNKLLSVYKEKWFAKVYQNLASDWERNDSMASRNKLQRMVSALNYEQVQNLPLMMQLIQLDLLVKSRLN